MDWLISTEWFATISADNKYRKVPRIIRRHQNAFRFLDNRLWRMNNKKITKWRDVSRNCVSNNFNYIISL